MSAGIWLPLLASRILLGIVRTSAQMSWLDEYQATAGFKRTHQSLEE
ncbi:MAG: hypothetical protein KGO02_21850 [Alphaproteobacteria bacterium]|nr:hypothetical protein [Alphaproteobacteria bacterium]